MKNSRPSLQSHPFRLPRSLSGRPSLPTSLLGGILLLTVFSTSCTQEVKPSGDTALKILCTTQMIAEPVRMMVPEGVEVDHLMGSGVDPHLYKPTPEDLRKVLRANLVLYHGLHLEGRMSDMLSQIDIKNSGGKAVAICANIPQEQLIIDESGIIDPHLWLDIQLWKEVCTNLKTILSNHGSIDSVNLEERFKDLNQYLDELDRQIIDLLGQIPQDRKILVTAHDAFAYFGKRYGFEVHGIQGISTESEPSLLRVNQLVKLLSDQNVPAIFMESTVPERNVRALIEGCERLGHELRIGGKLYSDRPRSQRERCWQLVEDGSS